MTGITVYGTDWCPMTQRSLEHLRRLGIEHRYIDIEDDPAARKWVKEQNGGAERKPTIDIDGRILSEPSNPELDEALAVAGRL